MQVGGSDAATAIEQRQQNAGAAVQRRAAAGDGAAAQAGGRPGDIEPQIGGQRRDGRALDRGRCAGGVRIAQVDPRSVAIQRRGEAGRAGRLDGVENVQDRLGARQVDTDLGAVVEQDLEVVGSHVDASAAVQGRECRAGRQRVEATGIHQVAAGPADEPCPFDARQRIGLTADRQLAVGEDEISVPRFVHRVAAQAAVDQVGAQAAGDRVVTRAADQCVGQVIAEDRVGERRAGDVAEVREFAEVGRQPAGQIDHHRLRSSGKIERVDPRTAHQDFDAVECQAVRAADQREAAVGQLGHRDVLRHAAEVDLVDALAVVAARGLDDRLHAPARAQHVGVAADAAGEFVVAGATTEDVVELVADDLVLARSGAGVLEGIHRRQGDVQCVADRLSVDPRQAEQDVAAAGRKVQRVGAARRFVEEKAAGLAGHEHIVVVAGAANQDHGTGQGGVLDVEDIRAAATGEGGLLDADERVERRSDREAACRQREQAAACLDHRVVVTGAAAGQGVGAGAAGQPVVAFVTGDQVVVRRADDVLEAPDLGEAGGGTEVGVGRQIDRDAAAVERKIEGVGPVARAQVLDAVEGGDAGRRARIRAADQPGRAAIDVVAGGVVGAGEAVVASAAEDRDLEGQHGFEGESVVACAAVDRQAQDAIGLVTQPERLLNRGVQVGEIDHDAAVGRHSGDQVDPHHIVTACETGAVDPCGAGHRRIARQQNPRLDRLER